MDRIGLRASGNDALFLVVADAAAASIEATALVVEHSGDAAEVRFAQSLQGLPRSLFEPAAGPATRLKDADALRVAAQTFAENGEREALETLRKGLRRLRRIEASIDLAAHDLFGLKGIADAGAATARLVLDLTALLPSDAFDEPPPGDVTLLATVWAEVAVAFGTVRATASVRVEVRLTADFSLDCDIGIDLPHLPTLPPFSLRLPRFALPHLRFAAIVLPPIAAPDFIGLRLKLPGVEAVLDDPKPTLALDVDHGGRLTIRTAQDANGRLRLNGQDVATFAGIAVTLGAGLQLTGTISAAGQQSLAFTPLAPTDLPFMVSFDEPCTVTLAPAGTFDFATGIGSVTLTTTIVLPRVTLRAKSDPSLTLSLKAKYVIDAGSAGGMPHGQLEELVLLAPYPLALATATGRALANIWRALAALPLPGAPGISDPLPALRHVARFLGACTRWLAGASAGAGRSLAALAEDALALVERLVEALAGSASDAMRHVAVDIRLDATTFALRQIVLTPVLVDGQPGMPLVAHVAGLTLEAPGRWRPSLLLDFSGPPIAVLCVTPDDGNLSLSTDLWLDSDEGSQAARTRPEIGAAADPPLLRIRAQRSAACVMALATLDGGQVRFFRKLADGNPTEIVAVGANASISLIGGRPRFEALANDVAIEVQVNAGKAKRLLPFLSGPSDLSAALPQSIEIHVGTPAIATNGVVALALKATLHLAGSKLDTTLTASLDLETLTTKLAGDDIVIEGTDKALPFLGMAMRILPKSGQPRATYPHWRLSFANGDASLMLDKDARAEFAYPQLASSGRGLVFHADEIAVSRNGLDLDAAVDPETPVVLAGIDQSFQFTQGRLVIRRGVLQTIRIAGAGALPPALVGEAKANVAIELGQRNGRIYVQSAEAELDLAGKPLECKATRFTFQIVRLGLAFEDFEDRGTHFYFQITGSARFTPIGDEFDGSLLGNLHEIEIVLDKAPLAADARLLAARISFQVAMSPPKRARLFEIFEFELRGFGFRPASPAFGGKPAICVSGQIAFLKSGDTRNVRFDFHELWIAPPKTGEAMPQIRCDGLGVSLSLGGAGSVEATAIAVDGQLPSMQKPLEPGITTRGFLASGRITVPGWAPMAASMGFLELRDETTRSLRHAFFMYAQLNRLALRIPIPFFELWLREAGFGFGFRYTLAALDEVDRVSSPAELIAVLDRLAKVQGELASIAAWRPEPTGDRLTLAMRAMFSMACVSQNMQLAPTEEKLPNPVLSDATVALRSDLTLMMTVRAWLCVNYARWDATPAGDELRRRPSLAGYLYLSAPKQMLLARMRNNRDGVIGDTPPMHPALKRMFGAVDWSSTLYVAPGIYHHEMGWPYELGFELGDDNGQFGVTCRGGTILRIEDGAVLQGVAFRAVGFAQFGGKVGGRSLGASVFARADFEIAAKLIAYLSLKRVSDTLFYGSFDFTVTLRFSVRVWLEFSIGFKDIHLETGFSVALCITVAIEVAATPTALAGRGRAQLSVAAFGRTLSLGVGFGFNEGALVEARARVDRFLTLGLTRAVPDPEKGLAQPPLASAPAEATRDADRSIDETIGVADALGPPAAPGAPPAGPPSYDPIKAPGFWAVLRPVAAHPELYLMTLIPHDTTAPDGASADAPGFYAPPFADPQYRVTGVETGTLRRLDYAEIKPVPDGEIIKPSYDHVAAKRGRAELAVAAILAECFVVDRPANSPVVILGQPKHRRIGVAKMHLGADASAAEATLRKAAEQAAFGNADEQAYRAIEERRSSLIAAIHDSQRALAEQIAVDAGGILHPPPRATPVDGGTPVIDARDFGLTFVVGKPELATLFDVSGVTSGPPAARFAIETRVVSGADPAPTNGTSVSLFNPPDRFFSAQHPALAGALCRFGAGAIELDWDLEPAWDGPDGMRTVYDDPEFHLAHYRISGVARTLRGGVSGAPVKLQETPITVRAAAPLMFDAGKGCFSPLRPRAQFADRLDRPDLASLREALFGQDWTGLDSGGPAATAVEIEYTIVAVDIAGTEGVPRRIFGMRQRQQPAATAPQRAEILFDYAAMPKDGEVFATPPAGRPSFMVLLRVTDDAVRAVATPPPGGTRYRLRLRRTRGIGAGRYGADALDDALARPTAADFARPMDDDIDFIVTHRKPPAAEDRLWPIVDRALAARAPWNDPSEPCFVMETGTLDDLRVALGVPCPTAPGPATRPRATRIALSRLPAKGDEVSPFVVADMALRIGAAKAGKALPPIETAVETFEHPLALAFEPLDFDDLDGESGRALALHPLPDATLRACVDDVADAGRWMRDRARRVGTRLFWNSRPFDGSRSAALRRDGMIGGFDIFAIDMMARSKGSQPVDVARRVARVQALPARMRAVDPAGIDDFGALECLYPSLTTRLSQGAARGRGLAPWFSTAESLLAWPRFGLRRSLGLDVEEAVLSPLFAQGKLDAFRLSLVDWPRAPAPAPPLLALRAVLQQPVPTPVTDPHGMMVTITGSPATALRGILCMLVFDPAETARKEAELESNSESYGAHAAELTEARLRVEAMRGGNPVAEVSLPLDMAPVLHPFLADVVDRLRWSAVGGVHRRYAPVLDGPPATKAKTLAELLVERGEARDPAGWAILRSFGLAAGLRLFDMERAEYCDAAEMRRLLDDAMADILPRYEGAALGAPFADLLWRPGGLVALQSFDGGGLQGADRGIDEQALALVQIALRPAAEALSGAAAPAAYVVVTGETGKALTLDMNVIDARACIAIEAIDLTRGIGAPKPLALARSGDAGAAALCPAGKPDGGRLETLAVEDAERPALMLRVVALFRNDFEATVEALVRQSLAGTGTVALVARPALGPTGGAEPFGAFAPLTSVALTAIVEGIDGAAPNAGAQQRFEHFKAAAQRFGDRAWWPDQVPERDRSARRAELAARYLQLVPRFLERGPAVDVGAPTSPFVSMTALAASEPWRVAPTPAGRMDALFLHDDRYARRHRYVVRPFGRYEHLDAAANGRLDGTADAELNELGVRDEPGRWDDLGRQQDAYFAERGVDIVVPRSHPLEPPTILSAGPILLPAPAMARRAHEIVLARHREEKHSEANSRIADRLGFRFVAVAPLRSFTQQAWAEGLFRPEGGAPDTLAAFGDGALPPAMPELSVDARSFDRAAGYDDGGAPGLTRRLPDGWRGLDAIRLRETIPHGIAVHAVAYAAAGVVVSDPVAATLGEGEYEERVQMPWRASAHAPVAQRPSWDLDGREVVVTAPLVRIIDGVRAAALDAWDLRAAPPVMFSLPDGTVVYALSLAREGILPGAVDVVGPSELSLETEWVPTIGASPLYEERAPGSRFAPAGTAIRRNPWCIVARLKRKAAGLRLDVTPPEPSAGGAADWPAFQAEIARVQGLLSGAGATALAAQLAPFATVTDDAGFAAARGGLAPFELIAGTPLFGPVGPVNISPAVTLPVGAGFDWATDIAAERAPDASTLFEALALPLPPGLRAAAEQLTPVCPGSIGVLLAVAIDAMPPDQQAIDALLDALAALSGVHGLNRRGAAEAGAALVTLAPGNRSHLTTAMPARVLADAAVAAALAALGASVTSEPLALLLHEPPSGSELAAVAAVDAELGESLREAALDQVWGPGRRPLWSAFQGAVIPAHEKLDRAR